MSISRIYYDNNNASIYVASLRGKQMEIIVVVSDNPVHHQPIVAKIDYEAITGNGSLEGLLAIKRALPGVIKWIRSIGFTPIADPADLRRQRAFSPIMKELGINLY